MQIWNNVHMSKYFKFISFIKKKHEPTDKAMDLGQTL